MAYYTNVGPVSGSLHQSHGYVAIGVLPAREIRSTIGMALAVGSGEGDQSLWRLIIDEAELPGLWIVVDREFRPAQSEAREPANDVSCGGSRALADDRGTAG
jgi:hypothetical protein